jgi:pyruvate/2-oxoglutarate dehydrogenase complex dihydrolipoamide acyltransferase (E2) component
MKSKRRLMISGIGVVASTLLVYGLIPHKPEPPLTKNPTTTLTSNQDGVISKLAALEGYVVDESADLVMFDDSAEQKELELAQQTLQKVADDLKQSGVAIALPSFPDRLGGRIVHTGQSFSPAPAGPKDIGSLPEVSGTPVESVPEPTPPAVTPPVVADTNKPNEALLEATKRVDDCRKRVTDGELALQETQKAVDTAKAIYERAKEDADKARMLLSNGAISANEASRKDSLSVSQKGIWENNQERLQQELKALESDRADLKQAEAELEKAKSAPAPTRRITAEVRPKTKTAFSAARTKRVSFPKPAFVVPRRVPASTEPTRVIVDNQAMKAANSRLDSAKKAVDKAENLIAARQFLAPKRVRIIRWLVSPGGRVKKGQALCEVELLPAVPKPKPKPESDLPVPDVKLPTTPGPEISGPVGSKPNIEEAERLRKQSGKP